MIKRQLKNNTIKPYLNSFEYCLKNALNFSEEISLGLSNFVNIFVVDENLTTYGQPPLYLNIFDKNDNLSRKGNGINFNIANDTESLYLSDKLIGLGYGIPITQYITYTNKDSYFKDIIISTNNNQTNYTDYKFIIQHGIGNNPFENSLFLFNYISNIITVYVDNMPRPKTLAQRKMEIASKNSEKLTPEKAEIILPEKSSEKVENISLEKSIEK